jgi:hypothetical protein
MWQAWVREKCVEKFGGKTNGQRLLDRPKNSWEDGISMDPIAIRGGGHLDFIHLAQVAGSYKIGHRPITLDSLIRFNFWHPGELLAFREEIYFLEFIF